MSEHPAEKDAPSCTCPYTDPSTWLSAASCGYGGGYEPGSMQEWNPLCPAHPRICDVPDCDQPVVELLSNDASCVSPEYAERYVCRWHKANPFPGVTPPATTEETL